MNSNTENELDSYQNAGWIGALTRTHERTTARILAASNVTRKARGYLVREAIPAIVAHYQGAAETVHLEAARDRARKTKAEAELRELDLAERVGQLMFRADASKLFADAYVRIRQTIEEADYIPFDDRIRLSQSFLTIELPRELSKEIPRHKPKGPRLAGRKTQDPALQQSATGDPS